MPDVGLTIQGNREISVPTQREMERHFGERGAKLARELQQQMHPPIELTVGPYKGKRVLSLRSG